MDTEGEEGTVHYFGNELLIKAVEMSYSKIFAECFVFFLVHFRLFISSDFYRDYEVSVTQRGRPKLIHKGYCYLTHAKYKGTSFMHWHCDQRWKGCKVRGFIYRDGKLSLKGYHNHGPKAAPDWMVQKITASTL